MTAQKKATVVSSSVAALLAIMKFVVGFISGSVAVLASAIDSLLDLTASLFNYYALHNSEKPADATFNYGRGKIEALAAVIEGSVITMSGLFILYESIKKVVVEEPILHIEVSFHVMLISFIVTIGLVWYLLRVAKATNNLVIKSDALHYKTDVLTNGGILISLGVIYLTDWGIVDSIVGGGIAIYIIYSAYQLLKEGVLMLLDRALDEEIVEKIKEIILKEELVSSYHYLKTRASGKSCFVDVHLVFNKQISLMEAHRTSDRIEFEISELDDDIDWIFSIHLDPVDDSDGDEFEHHEH